MRYLLLLGERRWELGGRPPRSRQLSAEGCCSTCVRRGRAVLVAGGGGEGWPRRGTGGGRMGLVARGDSRKVEEDPDSFEGTMVPSRGQAALLTFCTCISLGSVGLVLSIAVPEGGNNWFWLMTLSPLAGVYYWTKASRKEEIKVKMILSDDGNVSEILMRGDDVQVEQMRKELKFSEKGMIYVKGIFET